MPHKTRGVGLFTADWEADDQRSFSWEYGFTLGDFQGYGIAHVGGGPTGSYDLELDKKIRAGLGLGAALQ